MFQLEGNSKTPDTMDLFSYNNSGGLMIGGIDAFEYLSLNPDFGIQEEGTGINSTHNKLQSEGYVLIAIKPAEIQGHPEYMKNANFIDGEERVFDYKARGVFYTLFYAKSLKNLNEISAVSQVSQKEVFTFQNAISQILSGLPN